MSDPEYTGWGEIELDGVAFRLGGPITPTGIPGFPSKMTVGDYTKDSNDILSSWIISDATGGHGVANHRVGTTDNRYRIASLYTRYANQFVKPFAWDRVDIGSVEAVPLGDMYYTGTAAHEFYATGGLAGTTLYRDNVATGAATLTAVPYDKAVAFQGTGANKLLYIPMSSSGYATYERAGNTLTNSGAVDFRSFCAWRDKLIGVSRQGHLYYTTAAGAAFTNLGPTARLDPEFEPKRLHLFKTPSGADAVHIVTNRNVWVLDYATPMAYAIPDFESVHPYFGLASCVYRGNLYVSSGMDILQFNGEVISPRMSLSRDDGLPYDYQRYIVDLVAGQNALYALVRGRNTSGTIYYTTVHEFSDYGWHMIYAATQDGAPTKMCFSRADDAYRLYFGLDRNGYMIYQEQPVDFTNPIEAIYASGFDFGYGTAFAVTGTFDFQTGWWDAGMAHYKKIANGVHIDCDVKSDYDDIRVYYRVDGDTAWTQLGQVNSTGYHTFYFGTPDADGIYPGIAFYRIELKLQYQELDITQETSVINHMSLTFLKLQNPSLTWSARLDLTHASNGKSPEELLTKLNDLRDTDAFFKLRHRDNVYRVRITGFSGQEATGRDPRAMYDISIIQIPNEPGIAA